MNAKKTSNLPPQNLTPSRDNDVGEALQLLNESLSEEQIRIREEGSKALLFDNLATAQDAIDFSKKLKSFQAKVEKLAEEWKELEAAESEATPEVRKIVSKRFFGKKKRGVVTPEKAYIRPLLETLVEMGGSGDNNVVIDRVGQKMKPQLKPVDYEPLPSNQEPRWRNKVRFVRNALVNKDGRMAKGTPKGVWEISKAGRCWLEDEG